eukprot:629478-Pyramimonas_sp.AAC.1
MRESNLPAGSLSMCSIEGATGSETSSTTGLKDNELGRVSAAPSEEDADTRPSHGCVARPEGDLISYELKPAKCDLENKSATGGQAVSR